MIIRSIKVSNFGIYGGCQEFNLLPNAEGNFSRPIVLLIGKNGVGKTTLVEAIRLCLHGSLALGDRISAEAYDDYLINHIFKSVNKDTFQPSSSSVQVSFDYVRNSRLINYEVHRSWEKKGIKVIKELSILENGEKVSDITTKDAENFLRELISPAVADLFFFDGEKIRLLSDNDSDGSFLASKIQSLLGINLIRQLSKDIDIYITRRTGENGYEALLQKLSEASDVLNQKEISLETERNELDGVKNRIAEIKSLIAVQEQLIASEGGGFSSHLNSLRGDRERIRIEIEIQKRKVQEFCNGLMPFAIAREMCQKVASRLEMEHEITQSINTAKIIDEKLLDLDDFLLNDAFWKEINVSVSEIHRRIVLSKITDRLKSGPNISDGQNIIIHDFSEQQRFTVMDWINDCENNIPQDFCIAVEQLNALEDQFQGVIHNLSLIPANEAIAPLVETLNKLNQELGLMQHKELLISEEIQKLEFSIGQLHSRIRKVKEEIELHDQTNFRITLAIKSQRALEEYSDQLLRKKIEEIEKTATKRFNELCRKDNFLGSIKIDPYTFEISLFRRSTPFDRHHLSAGENQLFAISLMWALREVAGVPIPVIIDTPLSRLDNEHRHNMAHYFFPHASHQVILLATDAEVTSPILQDLKPSISHAYLMEYDELQGKTIVTFHEGWKAEVQK